MSHDPAQSTETSSVVHHRLTRRGAGFREALEHTFGALIAHRWQIIQTFKRDFANQSNLTRAGAFWNYVLPIVPLGAYVLLMAMRLFPSFGAVNGVVYITYGTTLWFLFSGFLRAPISLVEGQFSSLAKTNTPVVAATVASVSTLMFETIVRLVVVLAVFAIFQGMPSWRIVFTPFLMFAGSLFFFSVGLFLALFNLAYRDIAKIVSIVLAYGIFFSGVIFPMGDGPVVSRLLSFNPFYVFIENIRGLSVGADVSYPYSLAVFCALSFISFLVAVRLTYRAELRLRGWV